MSLYKAYIKLSYTVNKLLSKNVIQQIENNKDFDNNQEQPGLQSSEDWDGLQTTLFLRSHSRK